LVVAWKEVQTFEVGTARNLEEQKKIDVRNSKKKILFSVKFQTVKLCVWRNENPTRMN